MENKEPKLIIFDGLDRVGKSTTLQLVWKARGKIDTCIDRGILSNLVYNILFDRNLPLCSYLNLMPNNKNILYIYLTGDIKALKQRAIDTKDDMYDIAELEKQKNLFDNYYEILKLEFKNVKFVTINTTLFNQEEVVAEILEELK